MGTKSASKRVGKVSLAGFRDHERRATSYDYGISDLGSWDLRLRAASDYRRATSDEWRMSAEAAVAHRYLQILEPLLVLVCAHLRSLVHLRTCRCRKGPLQAKPLSDHPHCLPLQVKPGRQTLWRTGKTFGGPNNLSSCLIQSLRAFRRAHPECPGDETNRKLRAIEKFGDC